MLVASWRCLVASWRVLAGRPVHPLADPVRTGPAHQSDHPAWCGRGRHCDAPRYTGGELDWAHALMTVVEHADGVADTYLLRMDAIDDDGNHRPHERVVVTANGSMTAEEAEAFGLALLQAARQLAGGLAGLPGGSARAREMAAARRNRGGWREGEGGGDRQEGPSETRDGARALVVGTLRSVPEAAGGQAIRIVVTEATARPIVD